MKISQELLVFDDVVKGFEVMAFNVNFDEAEAARNKIIVYKIELIIKLLWKVEVF